MIPADNISPVYEPSARSDAAYAPYVDTSSVASKTDETSCGWRPAPGELVSLWDMLRIHGEAFYLLLARLSEIQCGIQHLIDRERTAKFSGWRLQKIGKSPRSSSEAERKALARKPYDAVIAATEKIVEPCTALGLSVALAQVHTLHRLATDECPLSALLSCVKELRSRIHEELKTKTFMFVAPQMVAYWSEVPLFDLKVQQRYKETVDDMVEAGKCLAAGRYTACVFHLMRVVEVGAKRLAEKTLGLSLSHKATLGAYIASISQEVAKMPTTTPKESTRKESFSKMADHLNHVKDGWRNKTMHPGRIYTEEQAFLMFQNVREFMRLLVDFK